MECVYIYNKRKGAACVKTGHRGKCPTKCTDFIPVLKQQVPQPFKNPATPRDIQICAFANLFQKFIHREQHKVGSENYSNHVKSRYAMGHFPFIPRHAGALIEGLVYVHKLYKGQFLAKGKTKFLKSQNFYQPKFLDCGAGIGNVVMLANAVGLDAYGIEYDEKTLERGHEVMKMFCIPQPEKRLFQGDLLTYKDFGKFDVLYGYCPMSDSNMEREFELSLFRQMKIGAILLGINAEPTQRVGRGEYVVFQRLVLDNYSSLGNPFVKIDHIFPKSKRK